jgi:glucose/arabinose dehydrogenase
VRCLCTGQLDARAAALVLLLCLAGLGMASCTSTSPAGGTDAGDAGTDAGDAGSDAGDAGTTDAGTPDGGGDAGCLSEAPALPPLKIVPVSTTAAGPAVFAAQRPGSDDWYLVEQQGLIRILRNGQILATPFLDVTAGIGGNLGERGLLGLAFHPDYAQNGRFFLMATPGDSSDGSLSAVSADAVLEFKRDPADPDRAVSTKVRDIVVLPASATNHNGGTILFGPDGFLYVGTGDGGGGCESDQPGSVQDTTKLFGKILRLDVDGAAPFAAPGNPFASDARVFHYGLRNPFRYNFDPATGDLFIGDVGQDTWEEISIAPSGAKGLNFGWPAFEGTEQGTCGAGKVLGGPSPHTPPAASFHHGGAGLFTDYRAVVAGNVYRGSLSPALHGVFFFADFYGADLGALRYCGGQVYGPVPIPLSSIPTGTGGGTLEQIAAFAQGHDGELYVVYGAGGAARIGRLAVQ